MMHFSYFSCQFPWNLWHGSLIVLLSIHNNININIVKKNIDKNHIKSSKIIDKDDKERLKFIKIII